MNWLKAHPVKAVAFTLLFTFIGTFAGCRADLFVPLLVAFLLALFMFVLVFSIDAHKIIVSLLAFLMVLAPCRPPAVSASQKKGGEVVVGVIIICGMTYCVYRLARFCQQHFPPPNTNNVNNANFGPATNNPAGGTNFGASFALVSDPCVSAGTNFVISPTSFTINAMVQGGQLRTAVSASSDSSSMEEFISGVQAQGLLAGTTSYAIDGEPAPPSSVPITFQPTTGTVTNGVAGTAFLITVQASSDMQTWQTLFSTTAGEGTAFQVQDTIVSPAMFYRLILQ
jgi:hypothetical protein